MVIWTSVRLEAWETTKENMDASAIRSLGYCEMKQHKPRFDEEGSTLLGERKQAKLQWLQNPSQINEDNLSNVRCETSVTFQNKKREYLKEKIKELETKYQRHIYRHK
jgi:hypothetical protein